MRIGFAGGGTGGHVFPVQSLIQYIDESRHAKHEYYWFGEKPSLEFSTYMTLRTQVKKIKFFHIRSGKWRREKELVALLKNIGGLFLLAWGVVVSIWYMWKHRIDVIFCKGGYVSLPVVIAGWVLRKKILLHESDTKAGLANRLCAKFSSTIFTGFAGVFPGKELVVGQILADTLVIDTDSVLEIDGKTHVLVTGGSQGSASMYSAVAKSIEKLGFGDCVFHVLLGTKNREMKKIFLGLDNVVTYDFVTQAEMGELLHQCNVSITRGGTTSLAEQELFGIKKIIVPIPWTHDQLKNGQYYKEYCDDVLVRQDSDEFQQKLEEAMIQIQHYTKGAYENPLECIRQTKETIVEYIENAG